MIRSRLASMEGNSPNLWNESAMSQESHLHVQKLPIWAVALSE